MRKKPLIIALVAAAVIASGYFFTKDTDEQASYLTEVVQRGDIEKNVVATGSIESINTVDVGAQVSGKVTKLYITLGQQVKKGDLIADIDSTTQINMLNTRKAELAGYQAQLIARKTAYDVAQSNYNRLSKLYSQKATSLDILNTAKLTLDNAKAEMSVIQENIKQAKIEVNTAETNVGYTKITAPIDGTVISTPVSEGQTVNSNQTTPTIVKIADLSKMRIKPEISEGDITKVKAGQSVSFTILSDNKKVYQAKIDSVDPATTTISDNSSNSSSSGSSSSSNSSSSAVYYYANIVVDNPDQVLRIGMTTENNIKIAEAKNVLFVPNMAVQIQNGKTFVSVLNGNNQPEQREVEIGIQNDYQTEIKSGVAEGEEVIVSQVAVGETLSGTDAPIIF